MSYAISLKLFVGGPSVVRCVTPQSHPREIRRLESHRLRASRRCLTQRTHRGAKRELRKAIRLSFSNSPGHLPSGENGATGEQKKSLPSPFRRRRGGDLEVLDDRSWLCGSPRRDTQPHVMVCFQASSFSWIHSSGGEVSFLQGLLT